MTARPSITVHPWLRKADDGARVPGDARFVCVYENNLGIKRKGGPAELRARVASRAAR